MDTSRSNKIVEGEELRLLLLKKKKLTKSPRDKMVRAEQVKTK